MRRGASSKPPKEYTEWEYWKVAAPHITVLANGEGRFQHQEYWSRFNNVTKQWESKLIIDPVKLRFEDATDLWDVYNLGFR